MKLNNLLHKGILFGVVLLFIGASVVSSKSVNLHTKSLSNVNNIIIIDEAKIDAALTKSQNKLDAGISVLQSKNNILSIINPDNNPPEFDRAYNEYTFKASLPILSSKEIKASDDNMYLSYSFDDCRFLAEPGKPMLPYQSYKVAVHSDAKNITVTVLDSTETEENLLHHIYPAEIPVSNENEELGYTYIKNGFFMYEDFYANYNDFYPGTKVEIAEFGNLRGFCYIDINVYMLQYRPVDKVLKIIEEIDIQVIWNSEKEETSREVKESFEGIFKNVLGYTQKRAPSGFTPQSNKISYPTDLADPANQADYLIIAAERFYASSHLKDLAHHRATYSNYNVAVVETSDIYAAVGDTIAFDPQLIGNGQDLEIKSFIKYAYDNWDNGAQSLQFILLVGDPDDQLVTYYLPVHFHEQNQIATDYWYSCINDDNEDEYIDDDDLVADLFIGRFSVRTTQHLSTVVHKTINYELYPPIYPKQEWGSRTLLTSGFEDSFGYMPTIRKNYLTPDRTESNEVYAYTYLDYQLAIADMKSQIDIGHAILAHSGHGWPYGWQIGSAGNVFNTGDVNDLNNGVMLPVVFSLSCSTGKFDAENQCLAEVFVQKPNKGSIAFIGSSRVSMTTSNEELLDAIMNSIFQNDNYILGSSILEAKLALNGVSVSRYNRVLYNLIGDPALNMSQTLTESHKPELSCSFLGYTIEEQNITFYTMIKNSGLSDANEILVELLDAHPKQGGMPIEDATRYADIPGQTEVILDITLTLQPEWDGNIFYLLVDRLEQTDEIDESNNLSPPLGFYINPLKIAPILNFIGDKTGYTRNLLEFMISARDKDSEEVVFFALGLPDGANLVNNGNKTATFYWTPTSTQEGEYDVTFFVGDGIQIDSETITIYVRNKELFYVADS